MLNIGDTKTKFLLGLAKTPLVFYPHYKYHLPLPTVLMIENTNLCNADCVICPRETLSRKRGFMDFGLFEKIIKEASSESHKPVTHLHGFGEPLLDKLLPDSQRITESRIPISSRTLRACFPRHRGRSSAPGWTR
jgi:hypothetical protein